jgi:heat shock protein HslJ
MALCSNAISGLPSNRNMKEQDNKELRQQGSTRKGRYDMKFLLVLAIFSSALVAMACQPVIPASDAGGEQLQGTIWVLADLGDEPVASELTVTAMFGEDGSLAGSSGCNNYSTSYEIDGQSITISPMIMGTMMMCPDPVMQVETAYLAALPEVAVYEIVGEVLLLRDGDGAVLLTYNAQSQSLAGTSWDVVSYNNGKEAVVSVIAGTELTALFDESGTVAGSSGCNNYNGSYEVDGENISMGPFAVTMKMCEEAAMEQEQQFFTAMESAATFVVEGSGSMLQFRIADGTMAVNLEAAE